MSENKSGGGAVIITVIVLVAGWVGFGMMQESQMHVPDMPKVATSYSPEARAHMSPENNPYIADLLAPRKDKVKTSQSARFSQLLKKFLDGKSTPLVDNNGKIADTTGGVDLDSLLNNVSTSNSKGDYENSKALVHGYKTKHDDLADKVNIDLAIVQATTSYKQNDFDSSREWIKQGIDLAHKNGDYQMDYLEGLRCLLSGNGSDATGYDLALSKYNEGLEKSDYKKLPQLADDLVKATGNLPEDSFFKLQAKLTKASSMVMAKEDGATTKQYLEKLKSEASHAHDATIALACDQLLAKAGAS